MSNRPPAALRQKAACPCMKNIKQVKQASECSLSRFVVFCFAWKQRSHSSLSGGRIRLCLGPWHIPTESQPTNLQKPTQQPPLSTRKRKGPKMPKRANGGVTRTQGDEGDGELKTLSRLRVELDTPSFRVRSVRKAQQHLRTHPKKCRQSDGGTHVPECHGVRHPFVM